MKMLFKDTLREIKKSLGRFLSIFAIVAIGVAFFAGVKASAPIMKYSADAYYDDTKLMDFRVVSTIGLNKNDVNQIRGIEGVEGVFATHTLDALVQVGSSEMVVKVMTLPTNQDENNVDYMNRAVISEGRLPQNEFECVIEDGRINDLSRSIGDKITLKGEDIDETLKNQEFTIVGKVRNPYYLSYQKGSSSIGNGSITTFVMILEDAFDLDYYTDLYLTVDQAASFNSYEDEYFELIDPIKTELEALGKIQAPLRGKEIKEVAYREYNDGLNEYYDNKKDVERELNDARYLLNKSFNDLKRGEVELADQRLAFEKTYNDNKVFIADGREELSLGLSQFKEQDKLFNDTKEATLAELAPLIQGIEQAEASKQALNDQLLIVNESLLNEELPSAQIQELKAQKRQLEAGIAQIDRQLEPLYEQYLPVKEQLEAGEKQLSDAKTILDESEQELIKNELALEEGKVTAESEFTKAQNTITQGWIDYQEGATELDKNARIADEKLSDAREELEKAEEDILALEDGEWIVLDRESHYSYMDYGSAADRMGAIAKIFPLFFFLVAALICLTTMTRMVDEQRDTIGALKALGYSKSKIAMKYIIYALLSSLGGSIVGVGVGFVLFPIVIYTAWNILYMLPDIQLIFLPELALQASLSAILITLIATLFAVEKELRETPALLLRPKSPKNGKRIFLEKIGFVWKRLSFSQKVTARNLIRYKKRFFMTVIGISGCTALLVAGFGIQDSIGDIVPNQFTEIQTYEANVQFKEGLNVVEKDELFETISNFELVSDLTEISQYNATVTIGGKDQNVSIVVPQDIEKYEEFVNLRTRINHTPVEIKDGGAIISEKMANDLRLDIGDTFSIKDSEDIIKKIKVNGIVENYVGHYITMSRNAYKATFGLTAKPTNVLLKVQGLNESIENTLGSELNALENITSITFFSGMEEQYSDMIKSLGFVIVVLIISAGLLAFVVLYNLTNVNISERIREIATIKVLGFYDKEVASYVFKENLLLSFIGSLVGLGLGTLLHRLVMSLAELDAVMFGREIYLQSYALSVLITMLFSWIVAKVMYSRLVKIPMVESLKSVE